MEKKPVGGGDITTTTSILELKNTKSEITRNGLSQVGGALICGFHRL